MRLPTLYQQKTPLRFNITPLIDVVFLLIIFFLVASHFVHNEQAQAVSLPIASAGETDNQQVLHRLTITINHNGDYFIGGEPQTEAIVHSRIEELQSAASDVGVDPEVRLRGHKDGQYGPMKSLIQHCAANNIRSLRFAVSVNEKD